MAFIRGAAGDITPAESIIFNYWTIVLHLLKLGIPWEAITNFSDAEINIEAETSGTIDYSYAIFKSTYTLPAKT